MKISVIIAAYNVDKYIKKCIENCVHQDFPIDEYEIIVVNDASTDNTLSILQDYGIRIKIVNNKTNMGLGASRNKGLEACTGKYIWFLDGDDFIEKNALTLIFNELCEKDLDGVVINYATTDEQGNIISERNYHPTMSKEIISGSEWYYNNFDKSYSFLYILKKGIFEGINFRERINMQDSEILPKLLHRVKRIGFLDTPLYYYVQQENSFTNSTNFEKRYRYFQSIIEVRDSLRDQLQLHNEDYMLGGGIQKKLASIQTVFITHLLYFPYEKGDFSRIITLLRQNKVFPLIPDQLSRRFKFLALGLNKSPWFTYLLFNRLRKII